jgi:hypothetical protein
MSHAMTDREYKRYTGLNLVDLKVILIIPFAGNEDKKAYELYWVLSSVIILESTMNLYIIFCPIQHIGC